MIALVDIGLAALNVANGMLLDGPLAPVSWMAAGWCLALAMVSATEEGWI